MCAQLPSSPNPARPSHHLLCVTLSALSIPLGCISTDLPFQRFTFCAVLRHAVLYCTVLHYTTLNCTQLHSTIESHRTICTALGGCSRQRCRERHREGPQHSWQASEDAGEINSLRFALRAHCYFLFAIFLSCATFPLFLHCLAAV